jgi:hypothetical protein
MWPSLAPPGCQIAYAGLWFRKFPGAEGMQTTIPIYLSYWHRTDAIETLLI